MNQKIKNKFSSAFTLPKEVEKRIEDGVRKTLSLLQLPSREEVNELSSRVDSLLKRCELLVEKKRSNGGLE